METSVSLASWGVSHGPGAGPELVYQTSGPGPPPRPWLGLSVSETPQQAAPGLGVGTPRCSWEGRSGGAGPPAP